MGLMALKRFLLPTLPYSIKASQVTGNSALCSTIYSGNNKYIIKGLHCWYFLWEYTCNGRFPLQIASTQIAKFMGPTWGPPGSCRPQMGPMLAPWTLLSGCNAENACMPWRLDQTHNHTVESETEILLPATREQCWVTLILTHTDTKQWIRWSCHCNWWDKSNYRANL